MGKALLIGGNLLGATAAAALSLLVRSTSAPERLEVSCNGFGEVGVLHLADALQWRTDRIEDVFRSHMNSLLHRTEGAECAHFGHGCSKPTSALHQHKETVHQTSCGKEIASCRFSDCSALRELVVWPV